jgi:hypothetical protein
MQEVVDNIRGAVMICYPMGLPEWDLVRVLLEDREADITAQVEQLSVSSLPCSVRFAGGEQSEQALVLSVMDTAPAPLHRCHRSHTNFPQILGQP